MTQTQWIALLSPLVPVVALWLRMEILHKKPKP